MVNRQVGYDPQRRDTKPGPMCTLIGGFRILTHDIVGLGLSTCLIAMRQVARAAQSSYPHDGR